MGSSLYDYHLNCRVENFKKFHWPSLLPFFYVADIVATAFILRMFLTVVALMLKLEQEKELKQIIVVGRMIHVKQREKLKFI